MYPPLNIMNRLYFDYNATTPIAQEAWAAVEEATHIAYANPSSVHQNGVAAACVLRTARKSIAECFRVHEDEVLFTSGGTESINTVFHSIRKCLPEKKEIITTAIEHSSVLKVCRDLERDGYKIHYIGVNSKGAIDLHSLESALNPRTAVVSVMHANNETGVLFPVAEISSITKKFGVLLHVDAVQSAGKIRFSMDDLGADYVSLSAHKLYGPKGIGALWIRKKAPFYPLLLGGSQEKGRRAGTENVAGAAGFGAAVRIMDRQIEADVDRLTYLRNFFEKEICRRIPGVVIHGDESLRIPNTSNLGFDSVDGELLVTALDHAGISVSMGSACMSGAHQPSHVLTAMGLGESTGRSAVRVSFGRQTTLAEVEVLINQLEKCVIQMRGFHAGLPLSKVQEGVL